VIAQTPRQLSALRLTGRPDQVDPASYAPKA